MFSLGTRKDVVALLIFDKIRGKNLYLEMTCNAANFLIDRDFGKKLTQRLPKIVILAPFSTKLFTGDVID